MSNHFENNDNTQPSATRKAAMLANDVLIITTAVASTVGLGMLAFEAAKEGVSSFKTWKSNRKNKTEN